MQEILFLPCPFMVGKHYIFTGIFVECRFFNPKGA